MPGKLKVKKAARAKPTPGAVGRGNSGSARATPAASRAPSRMRLQISVGAGRGNPVASRAAVVAVAKPVAKPVGKRDLKEFRRLLEEERRRLTEELEAMEEHAPEVEGQVGLDLAGSYDEDFADVAGDTFEREKVLAIESSVQALLTQVEEALARVEEGTYGVCLNCGRPIHPARLRAIPYAKLCIDCKAKEERANGVRRP